MLDTHGMGHNAPPISIDDLLNGEEAPSDAAVLDALVRRWTVANPALASLAEKAKKLADNKDRLPKQLDENSIEIALDLLAAICPSSEHSAQLAA